MGSQKMVQVRVLNVTRISLSPAGAARPEPLRLSFLDIIWLGLPPIQRLFLYRTDRPPSSVAQELRASLSRTIPRFYTLAGRFTHVPDSGDVVISFPADGDDGVDFLEAEAEGFDFQRLAEEEDQDVEAFSLLVPPLDVRELPARAFSVQVTGFAGAGVAVGLTVHHTAADGKALWQFLEAWAAECRGDHEAKGGGRLAAPVLDRSVIKHPRAEEIARGFLRSVAPNLPKLSNPTAWLLDRHRLSRRTFVVSAASLDTLRDRGITTGASRPSAFVALSAHIWITFLRAKSIPADDQNAIFCFLADCRRHLDPPVEASYFGNCVRPCVVFAQAKALLGGSGGFRAACAAIRAAIDGCLRERLGDCEDWMGKYAGLAMERLANVAASPRFRVYDADFGWGRPRRVELVSMNREGEVALVAARDEEGGVQASVALSPIHMDGFASLFLGGLQRET